MKLAILFSGGKDSMYSAWLAKNQGHKIQCLISIYSKNKDSFMFHTPMISITKKQSDLMNIPLITKITTGKKEIELNDLEKAISLAIKEYKIEGVVTGAIESVYQSSRVQKICNKLKIECFNPLWQRSQLDFLNSLIKDGFESIIVGVAAYPLDKTWIGKKINKEFINEVSKLQKKYGINPSGEGGEFESLIVNCPLFKKEIKINQLKITGEKNSWRVEDISYSEI